MYPHFHAIFHSKLGDFPPVPQRPLPNLLIATSHLFLTTVMCFLAHLSLMQLFLQRGSVFACFAGGIVHMLEGWTHHEVGPIDVDRMDVVWEAAMRQGFRPVV